MNKKILYMIKLMLLFVVIIMSAFVSFVGWLAASLGALGDDYRLFGLGLVVGPIGILAAAFCFEKIKKTIIDIRSKKYAE